MLGSGWTLSMIWRVTGSRRRCSTRLIRSTKPRRGMVAAGTTVTRGTAGMDVRERMAWGSKDTLGGTLNQWRVVRRGETLLMFSSCAAETLSDTEVLPQEPQPRVREGSRLL